MRQHVSVYQKQECFLLIPSSLIGQHGPWIAHQPGIGLSTAADDAVLGRLIQFIRDYSEQGLPPRDLREPLPFPLSSVAGVKSWGALAKASPIIAHINFDATAICVEKCTKDGQGHSVDSSASVHLPTDVSASVLGATVRQMFADAV